MFEKSSRMVSGWGASCTPQELADHRISKGKSSSAGHTGYFLQQRCLGPPSWWIEQACCVPNILSMDLSCGQVWTLSSPPSSTPIFILIENGSHCSLSNCSVPNIILGSRISLWSFTQILCSNLISIWGSMRKMRLRDVKWFSQGHRDISNWCWIWTLVPLIPLSHAIFP